MNIDLKKLRHVVTVAHCGSLSKAAERLHLSQPALSRSVAMVEEQLGVSIFERSAQGVTLTNVGLVTVEAAEKLLQQAHIFDHNVALYSQGDAGKIAFGMWPVISTMVLPVLSAHFMRERPRINMRASVKPASELLQALFAGQLEWLLCGMGQFEVTSDLEFEIIGHIDVGLVVRGDHPLTELPRITRQDLLNYPVFCGVELSQLPGDMIESGVFISDNFDVLRHTTLNSDGYWISPLSLVQDDLEQGRLFQLDVVDTEKPPRIPIALISLKGYELSPIARDVADYAKAFFQPQLASA